MLKISGIQTEREEECPRAACAAGTWEEQRKMDTYTAVKLRIFELCEEKNMAIYKLAMASSVAPSTIKNILYAKSRNPGIDK